MQAHRLITRAFAATVFGIVAVTTTAFALAADTTTAKVPAVRPASKLVLEIHEVKCIDETNSKEIERWGGDEITLAGVNIDAAGNAKLAAWNVGNFKRDGSVKKFSPARELASFDLRAGPAFPHLYRTMLVVVERDQGGGYRKRLDAIVAKANNQATKPAPKKQSGLRGEIVAGAGSAVGGAAGGAITGSPAGAQAGSEIGKLILKELDDLARQWGKDDLSRPQIDSISLPSVTHQWRGRDATSRENRIVKFHGGTYRITYSWRLVR